MTARPRIALPVAALALVTLSGSGCFPAPTRVSSEPAPRLDPIERLGRWDGETFVPVTPRSLPPSHVHVIVHGWAPGWGAEVIADPEVRAWAARDANGRRYDPWVDDLARVIAANDLHAVVLAYSWLDHAATGSQVFAQRNAWARTELHGRALATALEAAMAEDFVAEGGGSHLIGHSYGARVIAVAAIHMGKRPRQLTLFDSPDAPLTFFVGGHNRLADLLRKLPIGRGPGQVFVDNYVSMVGTRYRSEELAGIVDVALSPPHGPGSYHSRHVYPMAFYAKTAYERFGMGWSPFFQGHMPPPGCYAQPYGEVDLRPGCRDIF